MSLAATPSADPAWPTRRGPRPRTTAVNPHEQLDQNAPPDLQDKLVRQVLTWPGVTLGESWISVPGARAFLLDASVAKGRPEAFFGPTTEFAHIHPAYDGSLHAMLSASEAEAIMAAGWGEPHPMAARRGPPINNVMLYGPRDEAELATVVAIVRRSYHFGLSSSDDGGPSSYSRS